MAGAKDIAGTLDNSERLIVKFLAKNHKKGYSPEEIAKALKLDVDRVRHDCARLSDRGLVSISSKQLKFYSLGEEGKKAVSDGLPEELLVDKLRRSRKKLSVSGLSDFEKRVSLGWAKKNGWVEITPEKTLSLSINSKELGGKLLEVKKFLKTLSKGEKEASSLDREELAEALKARGSFLSVRQSLEQKVSVTGLGKELGRLELELRKEATSLTPELLKGGKWKGVSFRKYNLTAPTERVWPGREHPNRVIMRKIRNIFIEMGFQEMTGPWVETAFWNMDAMFIPQDHPAREVQDTFYLEGKGELPSNELVEKVKDAQENGAQTGSKGYGGAWDPGMAARLLLRTHTTATTFRTLGKGVSIPSKHFCIGRIFRNEALDATHLPEFYQVEGFVVDKGLNLGHLFGFLREFYRKMGFKKLRFKPTYNPYTEPSAEVYGYNETLGKWVEVGNSGIFRPEALAPFNIPEGVRIVAWGLGIERMSMDLYKRKDIRDILGAEGDLDWLRSYELPFHD